MIGRTQVSMSTTTTTPMKNEYTEPELSLPQLLDVIERRLDSIAGITSQTDATMLKQIEEVISRLPDIRRMVKGARNHLVPVNKLPPEILALVAAFFEPGRQLLNATAVCQYWRATLLSFPLLWSKIYCSYWTQLEAYLERSESVPLEIQLHKQCFHMFKFLLPHISRLAVLVVRIGDSSDFGRIAQYLRNPIPTLHKFRIASSESNTLELPPDISSGHFMHVEELQLEDISSFRAPRAFPHVTKLTWQVGPRHGGPVQISGLLDTLEQLHILEQVHLVFRTTQYTYTATGPSPVVTLQHVQRMSLCCSNRKVGIPPILEFLQLPNLASLVVDAGSELSSSSPALPVTSFGEHLPTLAELPEMVVRTCGGIGQVSFRSPSQVALEYQAGARPLGETAYHHDRGHWGGLPLHSVRRLTVTLEGRAKEVEDVWLVGLLRDLGSLEHLELEGYCGGTLRRLRRLMMGKDVILGIKTLTVRSGTYGMRQAMRLRDIAGGLGLGIDVTYIPDRTSMSGPDGLSEGRELGDESESDEE